MPWPEVKFGWEFSERYKRGERPPIPADCPFRSLIMRCWAHHPADRPAFSIIYEDLEKMKKGAPPSQPRTRNTMVNGHSPVALKSAGTARPTSLPPPGAHSKTFVVDLEVG
jgi:hypothetical protein